MFASSIQAIWWEMEWVIMCKIFSWRLSESIFFVPTGKFKSSVFTEHKKPPDSKYTYLESVRFVDLLICWDWSWGRLRRTIQIYILPMYIQSGHLSPQICLVQRHAEFLEELQVGEVCREIIQRQTGRHRHLKWHSGPLGIHRWCFSYIRLNYTSIQYMWKYVNKNIYIYIYKLSLQLEKPFTFLFPPWVPRVTKGHQ